ncbi:hypothetical protein FVR03_15465 [Pontibacter qinzhouensis]|uniref:Uncharacterized protein n=1 Tax=Pontibacter qinzhouensis TaxID=2603253 RepID=A0A5C8JK34_9BACT|nr:hypothetical protein [Pontibacter qinzhouensis]TXK37406.1 hypothetical protein FVR03_15465 [Pontibacter qinzhouensis]
MKNILLLCLLSLLLLASTCRTEKLERELLEVTWLHSFEEDEGDTLVFRPNTYDFPPSRGRTGFAIENKGVFKEYLIAPTDGLEEHVGQWTHGEKKALQIRFKGEKPAVENYTLEIVSIRDKVLKVKKAPLATAE